MSNDPRKKIVESLIERTTDGSLQWNRTPEDILFEAQVGENRISIKFDNAEFETLYSMNIYNKHGDVVEAFSDEDLDAGERGQDGRLVWFPRMKTLYTAARRNALGTDVVMKDILDELDKLF